MYDDFNKECINLSCDDKIEVSTNQDSHYKSLPIEPIEVIKKTLTDEEYIGFLKGSWLKYKLRAGSKANTDDQRKALVYEKWYKNTLLEVEQKKCQLNEDLIGYTKINN